jgi:hypothetical protein
MTDGRHRQSGRITYIPEVTGEAAERSLVVAEAMVWMQSWRNATAQVVVAFERNKEAYSWQTLTVQDGVRRARTWSPVKLIAFVPPDVRPGDRVSVKLENKRDLVYIDDLKMRWLTAVWPDRSPAVPDQPLR